MARGCAAQGGGGDRVGAERAVLRGGARGNWMPKHFVCWQTKFLNTLSQHGNVFALSGTMAISTGRKPHESRNRMVDANSLAQLSHLATKLNSQSNELNSSIDALNNQLASLNLGLEVWLDSHPIEDTGLYYIQDRTHKQFGEKARDLTILGYSKVDEKWQLAIKEETFIFDTVGDAFSGTTEEQVSDGYTKQSLLKASREIRMRATLELDNLVTRLKQKAEETLKGIEAAERIAAIKRPDRFYIYENWQAGPRKAVIHKGSCGHCNDGNGVSGGYDPKHAKWHGPFESLAAAHEGST